MMILDMASRQILVHFGPDVLINPWDRRYRKCPPILSARDQFETFRWEHCWPDDAGALSQLKYSDACRGLGWIRCRIHQLDPSKSKHEIDRLIIIVSDVVGYANTLHRMHHCAVEAWRANDLGRAAEQLDIASSLESSHEGRDLSTRILRRELLGAPATWTVDDEL